MADNLSNRRLPDRLRINVKQHHEVRYWSKKFGVSEDQLRKAVEAVGPMADAVERELKGGRQADGTGFFR